MAILIPASTFVPQGALDVDFEDLYALAGYDAPERLPEFGPYLRAKYDLSETAMKQLTKYFEGVAKKSKKGRRRGKPSV